MNPVAGLPTSVLNYRTAFTPVDPFQAQLRIHPAELCASHQLSLVFLFFRRIAMGDSPLVLRQAPPRWSEPMENEVLATPSPPKPPDFQPPCKAQCCTTATECLTCAAQRCYVSTPLNALPGHTGIRIVDEAAHTPYRPSRRCCLTALQDTVKPLIEDREHDLSPVAHRRHPENRFLGSDLENSMGALVPREGASRLDAPQFTECRITTLEENPDGPFELSAVMVNGYRKENKGNLDVSANHFNCCRELWRSGSHPEQDPEKKLLL